MKLPLAGLLLTFGLATGFAEIPPVPRELDEFAQYVIRENPTPQDARRVAAGLDPVIEAQANEAARALFGAMRVFLVGFAELGHSDQDRAREYFEETVRTAERANAMEPSSEGFRLLADAHNQLLNVGNMGYKMFNAWRPREAALRAVELDDENPLAHISAAAFFVSAPPIAGGDLQRGETHIARARELERVPGSNSEYVQFLVAVWEGRLAARRGSMQQADAALQRAHAIYPRNWWLAEIAAEHGISLE